MIKAYLGSGLLAIPYAFRCGGFLSGTIGLLLLALISNTTLKMLIWMRRRFSAAEGEVTFSLIGEYSTGVWGRRLALFAEIATNVGIAVGYLIFIGNTALIVLGAKASDDDDDNVTLHNKWLDSGSGSLHLNLIIVACAIPLILFAQLRSMKKMGFVSILGNVAIISAIIVVMYTSISTVSWDDFPSFPNRHIDWTIRLAKMPYFFGIAMFSFTIHGIVLPIEASMQHPEHAYKMFDRCIFFVVLSYVVFGGTSLSLSLSLSPNIQHQYTGLGYLAFTNGTDQSILDNLPRDKTWKKAIASAVQIMLCVAMLLTVPLFNYAVIKTIEDLWFSPEVIERWNQEIDRLKHEIKDEENEERPQLLRSQRDDIQSTETFLRHLRFKRQLLRVGLVFGLVGVAILLGPLFSQVIGFVGAFSMSAMAFILPSWFYLNTASKTSLWRSTQPSDSYDPSTWNLVVARIILVFGVLAMIGATITSLFGIVGYFRGESADTC